MLDWRTAALSCVIAGFLSASVATAAAGPVAGSGANDESVIWSHERAYWRDVQQDDLTAYRRLWHEAFLGWPYVSTAPVSKSHITDWITTQTGKGLRFEIVRFQPAALRITGKVAAAFYWITFQWVDKTGKGTTTTLRVMHTWLKDGADWHIIDGMSMPKSG